MPTKRLGMVSRVYNQEKRKFFATSRLQSSCCMKRLNIHKMSPLALMLVIKRLDSPLQQKKKSLSYELELLSGMSERLKERAMYRRNRRARKRYRPPYFKQTPYQRLASPIYPTQTR